MDTEGRKRHENEKKFPEREDLPSGGRRYAYEVQGHHGWTARYVKVVDASEETIRFCQEIYDERRRLLEIHEKYPNDRGHVKIEDDTT